MGDSTLTMSATSSSAQVSVPVTSAYVTTSPQAGSVYDVAAATPESRTR
jgi:hypothetical protein